MPKMLQLETGVYIYHNHETGKNYVGSASDSFKIRWYRHLWDLKRGSHHSPHLQRSWDKHGEAAFEFFVVERCPPDLCVEREQHWIDFYEACNIDFGYNISPTAGSTFGMKQSFDTKLKTKAAIWSRRSSIALRMLGNKHGHASKGQEVSQETRDKISKTLTGRKLSDEARAKLKKTPEQIEAMKARLRGRKQPQEEIEKRRAANKGKKRSGQALANIRAGALKRKKQ